MNTKVHKVQSGETLAQIAKRHYGDATLYKKLATYNHLSNPNLIMIGQKIQIPPTESLKTSTARSGGPATSTKPGSSGGSAQGKHMGKPSSPAKAPLGPPPSPAGSHSPKSRKGKGKADPKVVPIVHKATDEQLYYWLYYGRMPASGGSLPTKDTFPKDQVTSFDNFLQFMVGVEQEVYDRELFQKYNVYGKEYLPAPGTAPFDSSGQQLTKEKLLQL